jgi:hypothetical protein
MSDFKASMPRQTPPQGRTTVVFSIKTARGTRLELAGEYDEDGVLALWKGLIALDGKKKANGGA